MIIYVFFSIVSVIWASQLSKKWESWWHYKLKEVGGPEHWGQSTSMPEYWKHWAWCSLGRMQSPVSIATDQLIYDKQLTPLEIFEDSNENLELQALNTGKDIQFNVEKGSVIIKGGPLSYEYEVYRILLKFGKKSSRGSDHLINNFTYPGEIQVYGYNRVLYSNFSEAISKTYGIASLVCFFKIDTKSNTDFAALIAASENVIYKDNIDTVKGIKIDMLLPSTKEYITYEGSIPHPPCYESVLWIILNEPISVTETQMKTLRKLRASKNDWSGIIADNFRPAQNLNRRALRTNIQLTLTERVCRIERDFFYSVNDP